MPFGLPRRGPVATAAADDLTFLSLVLDFTTAPIWPDSYALLETHPELLGKGADQAIVELTKRARAQGDSYRLLGFELHRRLLAYCRKVGVDRAFAEFLARSALEAHDTYRANGLRDALDAAVDAFRMAVALTGENDPRRLADTLLKLANALSDRDKRNPNVQDLDESIELSRRAIWFAEKGRADLHRYLSNYAASLRDRFGRTGSVADFEAAFAAATRAMDLTPKRSPDWPSVATLYQVLLIDRFRLVGNGADLNNAIAMDERVLAATHKGDPALPGRLGNHYSLLRLRFGRDGQPADLDLAIETVQRAVSLTTDRSPEKPTLLMTLGLSLLDRHMRDSNPEDLDRAYEATESALELGGSEGSDAARLLSGLGIAQRARYTQRGNKADLTAAIASFRRSVALTPPGSLDLRGYLSNLGVALRDRYGASGNAEDLRSSIDYLEQAVALTPNEGPELAALLGNRGVGLQDRYQLTGAREDLDEAIDSWRRAVALSGPEHTDLPAWLTNLSGGLQDRYQLTGDLTDLDDAVTRATDAVAIASEGHLELPSYLVGLAGKLLIRYGRSADPEDLDRALEAYKEALDRTPEGHPYLPGRLSGLGLAMRDKSARTQNPADLDAAIDALERAVKLPEDHSGLPSRLNNLGIALASRFALTGSLGDLDAAIDAHKRAAELATEDHPEYAGFVANLAAALRDRFNRSHVQADLDAARVAYRSGCTSGLLAAPYAAVVASRGWLDWAIERTAWGEAAEAGDLGLQAADQLNGAQAFRSQKESRLGETVGIAAQTAYAWAQQGDARRAIAAVERGRAVLLSDSLRVRTELDRLEAEGHDGPAKQYTDAAAELMALERPSADEEPEAGSPSLVQRRSRARDEFDAAIRAIQELHGHEGFLRRIPDEQLLEQASQASCATPLAYLMAAPPGGVAIVLLPGGSVVITDLPDLSEIQVRWVVSGFQAAYRTFREADRAIRNTPEARRAGEDAWGAWSGAIEEVCEWVWTHAIGSLVATLRDAGFAEVTIVPTGLLGLLPLHAASFPDPSAVGGHRFALDEVLIRYAPNAQALIDAGKTKSHVQPDSLMGVQGPSAAKEAGAANEIRAAAAGFSADRTTLIGTDYVSADKTTLIGTEHTMRQRVLFGLKSNNVVHFACHGRANPDDPLESFLLISDDESLTLRDILTQQRLPASRLVVLSACESAVVGTALPDEVVGLPTGLVQAGAAAVIGSLWSVDDLATAVLFTHFYELWRRDGLEMSEALRQAQRWTRDLTAEARSSVFPDIRFPGGGPGSARPYHHPFFWAAFQFSGA